MSMITLCKTSSTAMDHKNTSFCLHISYFTKQYVEWKPVDLNMSIKFVEGAQNHLFEEVLLSTVLLSTHNLCFG